MCITVTLYQVVPRHLILQKILLLISYFPSQNQVNYLVQKNQTTAWKIKKDIILRNRNTGECSCCNSSQAVSETRLFT